MQYCDKIKNIVDFLGTRLSDEELMKIWKMQVCKETCVVYQSATNAEMNQLRFVHCTPHSSFIPPTWTRQNCLVLSAAVFTPLMRTRQDVTCLVCVGSVNER